MKRSVGRSLRSPALLVLPLIVLAGCGGCGGRASAPGGTWLSGAGLPPTESPGPPLTAMRGVGWWPSALSEEESFSRLQEGAEMVYLQRHAFAGPDAQTRAQDRWLDRAGNEGLAKFLAIEPFGAGRRETLFEPEGFSGAANWANPAWRDAYRDHLVALAQRHAPEYFCIAVEANMYYTHEPEDYDAFVSAFPALRRAILDVSPGSSVFASYQYEILIGESEDWITTEPQLELLEEKALDQDLLGISSYPLFNDPPYDPNRIPDDYYDVLTERSALPVFFAEIGFYSSDQVSPPGSESSQALFVRKLRTLLEDVEVEGLCWINLSDFPPTPQIRQLFQNTPQFLSFALLHSDLRPKSAWSEWTSLPEDRFSPEAMARLLDASMSRAPSGPTELMLGEFIGVGSTESAALVASAAGDSAGEDLRWAYPFAQSPMSMLLFRNPPSLGGEFQGLELQLFSQRPTLLVVILEEESGAKYEARFEILGGGWETHRAEPAEFTLQANSTDPNGRLDPDQIQQVPFIDFSGFLGVSGENEIRFHRIAIR